MRMILTCCKLQLNLTDLIINIFSDHLDTRFFCIKTAKTLLQNMKLDYITYGSKTYEIEKFFISLANLLYTLNDLNVFRLLWQRMVHVSANTYYPLDVIIEQQI